MVRKITLAWVTSTPEPYTIGTVENRVYEVLPDGSRERVELEIQYED